MQGKYNLNSVTKYYTGDSWGVLGDPTDFSGEAKHRITKKTKQQNFLFCQAGSSSGIDIFLCKKAHFKRTQILAANK